MEVTLQMTGGHPGDESNGGIRDSGLMLREGCRREHNMGKCLSLLGLEPRDAVTWLRESHRGG